MEASVCLIWIHSWTTRQVGTHHIVNGCKGSQSIYIFIRLATHAKSNTLAFGSFVSFCSTRSIPSVHDEYIPRVARFDIFRVHTVNSSTVIRVLLDSSNRLSWIWSCVAHVRIQKSKMWSGCHGPNYSWGRSMQARAHFRSFDFQFVQRN